MSTVLISYAEVDQGWAEWLAWQVEQLGYQVRLRSWHAVPGVNHVRWLHDALGAADRTLLVLTADYLAEASASAQWQAAFTATADRLLPVLVADCSPQGLLGNLVPIDLVGLTEQRARTALADGLRALRVRSASPTRPPGFPGPATGPAPAAGQAAPTAMRSPAPDDAPATRPGFPGTPTRLTTDTAARVGPAASSSQPLRVFLSVAGPDRGWARWVAHELRRADYDVEYDEWSWPAGSSFLERMDAALARADRVLTIVSPAYLSRTTYGREEREAAQRLAHDRDGVLIPVIVADCELPPLLGRLSHIRLVGLPEAAARSALLNALRGPQPPDLDETIPFPGDPPGGGSEDEAFPRPATRSSPSSHRRRPPGAEPGDPPPHTHRTPGDGAVPGRRDGAAVTVPHPSGPSSGGPGISRSG